MVFLKQQKHLNIISNITGLGEAEYKCQFPCI